MKTFHIIEVRYIAQTNKKPRRIRLRSARFQQTVYISAEEWETGADWLKAKGFQLVGAGYTKNDVIIVSNTFESLKVK